MLITAHWDSVEQHMECISSDLNVRAMADIAPLAKLDDLSFFHVDKVWAFEGGDGAHTSLTWHGSFKESFPEGMGPGRWGILTIFRIGVLVKREDVYWEEDKAQFQPVLESCVKEYMVNKAGFEHVCGWRIEKVKVRDDSEDYIDEFVVVGAWKNESAFDRVEQVEKLRCIMMGQANCRVGMERDVKMHHSSYWRLA